MVSAFEHETQGVYL